MLTAKTVKGLAERLSKAEALVAAGAVTAVAGLEGYYVVLNGDGTQHYLVHVKDDGTACCSCPDYQERQSKAGEGCKHIYAAEIFSQTAPKAKRSKVEAKVDGAAALARLQGDDDVDPWNAPQAA